MKRFIITILISISIFNVEAAKKQKAAVPAPEHSIVVMNSGTNSVALEKNANVVRSMASITKLMTAMVVLDQMPNPLRKISLKSPYMGRRDYTVSELLKLTLVRSDNYAAEILSKNFLGDRQTFIRSMNDKARSLGMWTAEFQDPTGLSAGNSATARDIVKMVAAAGTYPDIRALSSRPEVELETLQGKKTRTVSISNTNKVILDEFDNIIVSKTGFTSRAGRCLAMLVERAGHQYAVVILGEPSKQRRDYEARNLIHTYVNLLDQKGPIINYDDNPYSGV